MARPKVMVDLKCAWCGSLFQRQWCNHNKSISLGSTEFYCGRACSQAHHAVKNAKPCRTCGKPVVLAGKCRGAAYCSAECHPKRIRLKELICPACGVVFQPKHSRQAYCEASCANTAHSTRMIGQGNSHYKDGSSYASLFNQMRLLVMERDKGCVVCTTARGLQCHHINEDVRDNRPENLVMLCRKHHIEHHKSSTTPFPWLSAVTVARCACMTSRLRMQAASLLTKYSPGTA